MTFWWMYFWLGLATYAAIGVGITIWLHEPERDGWLWRILLWPLELAARYY
jgi:hypothetical protein